MKPLHFRTNVLLAPLCAVLIFAASHCPGAETRLAGWFVKTEINRYSSRLHCTYYLFFPSGHMYFGNPPTTSQNVDYAALYAANPKNCGSFTLVGEKLTLQRNDGSAPEAHTYSPGGGGIMDACPLSRVWLFDDGARLEGKWGIDMAISARGYSTSTSTASNITACNDSVDRYTSGNILSIIQGPFGRVGSAAEGILEAPLVSSLRNPPLRARAAALGVGGAGAGRRARHAIARFATAGF